MSAQHTQGRLITSSIHPGIQALVAKNDANLVVATGASIADAQRLAACWNACEGLTQDYFDGGWTAKDLSKYARKQEVLLASANAKIEWMRSLVDAAQAGQRDMLARADAAGTQWEAARELLLEMVAEVPADYSDDLTERIRAFLKGGA